MNKLHGWTVWRLAREAGVRPSTIMLWARGNLVNPWSEWRIKQTLAYLGVNKTP